MDPFLAGCAVQQTELLPNPFLQTPQSHLPFSSTCTWHFSTALLFIIYINNLPDYCNDLHTKIYIYADDRDTKLYRHIFNTADQDKLQKDIQG